MMFLAMTVDARLIRPSLRTLVFMVCIKEINFTNLSFSSLWSDQIACMSLALSGLHASRRRCNTREMETNGLQGRMKKNYYRLL